MGPYAYQSIPSGNGSVRSLIPVVLQTVYVISHMNIVLDVVTFVLLNLLDMVPVGP
jgi:hypothetical protein